MEKQTYPYYCVTPNTHHWEGHMDTQKPLYVVLARTIGAYRRCVASPNPAEGAERHKERIETLCNEHLPSGSGFDRGSEINLEESTDNKLVFETSFHHMDGNGFYDGWTKHTVTVLPDLSFGYRLKVGGRDRNEIKEHIYTEFQHALDTLVEEHAKA